MISSGTQCQRQSFRPSKPPISPLNGASPSSPSLSPLPIPILLKKLSVDACLTGVSSLIVSIPPEILFGMLLPPPVEVLPSPFTFHSLIQLLHSLFLFLVIISLVLICLTANNRAKYQAMKFGGRIDYCRTANEVERGSMELLDKIKGKNGLGQVSLGFDIEWRPSFRRGLFARTIHCFMQLLLIAS